MRRVILEEHQIELIKKLVLEGKSILAIMSITKYSEHTVKKIRSEFLYGKTKGQAAYPLSLQKEWDDTASAARDYYKYFRDAGIDVKPIRIAKDC